MTLKKNINGRSNSARCSWDEGFNIGPKQQQKWSGHQWRSSSLIVYYPIDFFLILAFNIKIIKSKPIPPQACGHRCVHRLVLPRDCKGVVWLELLAGQNVGKPSPGFDVQLTRDSEGAQFGPNHSNKHDMRWHWKCWEHWKPLAPKNKLHANSEQKHPHDRVVTQRCRWKACDSTIINLEQRWLYMEAWHGKHLSQQTATLYLTKNRCERRSSIKKRNFKRQTCALTNGNKSNQ